MSRKRQLSWSTPTWQKFRICPAEFQKILPDTISSFTNTLTKETTWNLSVCSLSQPYSFYMLCKMYVHAHLDCRHWGSALIVSSSVIDQWFTTVLARQTPWPLGNSHLWCVIKVNSLIGHRSFWTLIFIFLHSLFEMKSKQLSMLFKMLNPIHYLVTTNFCLGIFFVTTSA